MSAQHPKSGKPSGQTPGKSKGESSSSTFACAEFEALLMDALDGKLTGRDAAAFEKHRADCAACAQLLEDAKRGGEWLHFLETEPEVPSDLVARILAQTSGAVDTLAGMPPGLPGQAAIAGMPVAVVPSVGWLPGLERHAAQSRWMMTAAMAFFSIAFTLNLTGVRLSGLRLSDLAPTAIASSVSRQFYAADAHLMRYYDNLRFVYELESRVREIKRDVVPGDGNQGGSNPAAGQETAPAAGNETTQPKQKKPSDGSARKTTPPDEPLPSTTPAAEQHPGEPVMASLYRRAVKKKPFAFCAGNSIPASSSDGRAVRSKNSLCLNRESDETEQSKKIDRAERSLA